jgi:hypothetical protein
MQDERAIAKRRFVSSQDVAKRAGVSRSAVSRAFTPGASIAPATLARVQAAADALGYQVNDPRAGCSPIEASWSAWSPDVETPIELR